MDTRISKLGIRRVFTGRGDLTVEVEVYLEGSWGRAIAPAGASRGRHELSTSQMRVLRPLLTLHRWVSQPHRHGCVYQVAVDRSLRRLTALGLLKIGGAVAVAHING
jgi:Enolase